MSVDAITQFVLRENCIVLCLKGTLPESFHGWIAHKFNAVGLEVEIVKVLGENAELTEPVSKRFESESDGVTELCLRVFASGNGEALLFEAERSGLLKPATHPSYQDHPLRGVSTTPAALASLLAAATDGPDQHALHKVFTDVQLASVPQSRSAASLRAFVTRVLSPSDVVMLTSQLLDDAVDTIESVATHCGLKSAAVHDLHVASASPTAPDLLRVVPALRAAGILHHETAMHVRRHAKAFLASMVHPKSWCSPSRTVDAAQAYFGDEVGVYFAWIAFSIRALLLPGGVALALWTHRPEGTTVDTSPYVPLHSLLVIPLWAVAFVRLWQQQSTRHAAKWGSLPALAGSARRFEPDTTALRPGFHGEVRISAVTGKPTTYYPSWRRWVAYVQSALVTALLLLLVLAVMVCFLNVEGYMHDPSALLHVPGLYDLAKPGAMLDPNQESLLPPLVPVVLHVGVILFLNQGVYARVAQWLTERENHATAAAHETSLAVKRFVFEACDCYIAMAYLAFGARDVLLLRSELVSVFSTDSFRRIAVEALLPLAKLWLHLGRVPGLCSRRGLKKAEGPLENAGWSVQAQLSRDPFEGLFDDYLELCVQFGFVTLFAGAFPLAALVSVMATWLESRSDTVKLCVLLQRPIPKRSSNTGVWEYVLVCQAWLAVLSNVLLFGFASDQLAVLVPEWFEIVGTHSRRGVSSHVYQWRAGEGRDVVAAMWVLEHVVLLAALGIWLSLPAVAPSVSTRISRTRYLEAQAARGVDLRRAARTRAGEAAGGPVAADAAELAADGEELAEHMAHLRPKLDLANGQGDNS